MSKVKHVEFKIGTNTYVIETGELALQAGGSVKIQVGDTVVLVAASSSKKPRPGIDFFPLMVDYEEKMYAVGKIPGSYHRRESRPPESAILTSRLIDRPIRPLFPEGYRNDVQVVATLVSSDQSTQADIIAVNGASAALALSDVPFMGPIGAVRIGWLNNKWVVDPTYEQTAESSLDLVVAGTDDAILMVEAGSNMLNEEMMLSAIEFGHKEIKKIVTNIKKFAEKYGKPKQKQGEDFELFLPDARLTEYVMDNFYEQFAKGMHIADKQERKDVLGGLKDQVKESLTNMDDDNELKQIHQKNPDFVPNIIDNIEKNHYEKYGFKRKSQNRW